ncbi:hypothetical protein ACTFIR_007715 [Dictyostelium discoideum]
MSDLNILVIGDKGTGKTTLANALHSHPSVLNRQKFSYAYADSQITKVTEAKIKYNLHIISTSKFISNKEVDDNNKKVEDDNNNNNKKVDDNKDGDDGSVGGDGDGDGDDDDDDDGDDDNDSDDYDDDDYFEKKEFDFIICLFDITSRESWGFIKSFLLESEIDIEYYSMCKITVIGSKDDLNELMAIENEELEMVLKKLKISYQFADLTNQESITSLVTTIFNRISSNQPYIANSFAISYQPIRINKLTFDALNYFKRKDSTLEPIDHFKKPPNSLLKLINSERIIESNLKEQIKMEQQQYKYKDESENENDYYYYDYVYDKDKDDDGDSDSDGDSHDDDDGDGDGDDYSCDYDDDDDNDDDDEEMEVEERYYQK